MKIIGSLCLVAAIIAIGMCGSGCTSVIYPGGPTPGGVFLTHVRAPAQNLAVAVDPTARNLRPGKASCGSLMYMFAFGDASVDTAMRNSGITKVHHVDYEVDWIFFGFWVNMSTIVYGE